MELVGYEDEEAGRSLRLQSWEVHRLNNDDGYDSGYNDGFEQGYKKGLEQAQDKDRRDFGEESHTKGCGLKTDIIIIDDLISNDGASKETTQVVIDFIKNKNKPKI